MFAGGHILVFGPFMCHQDQNPLSFRLRIRFWTAESMKRQETCSLRVLFDDDTDAYMQKAVLLGKGGNTLFSEVWPDKDKGSANAEIAYVKGGSIVGWEIPRPKLDRPDETWVLCTEVGYETDPLIQCEHSTSPLQSDLLSLLESGKDADVKFVVKGETLMAHKLLLNARLPYFESLFE